jgi:hypothetical protein
VRDRRHSSTFLEIANRAVIAFEEYVEQSIARNAEVRWASTGDPGSGQLIFCVNGREVLYVSRERIEAKFAEMDRQIRAELATIDEHRRRMEEETRGDES